MIFAWILISKIEERIQIKQMVRTYNFSLTLNKDFTSYIINKELAFLSVRTSNAQITMVNLEVAGLSLP